MEDALVKEWQELISSGAYIIYKMTKDGERDFYFDSTDLPQCQDKFFKKRQEGWEVAGKAFEGLSHRLPERASDIKALDLELFEWGYQKRLHS